MDFELTEDQSLLKGGVQRLIADHYAFEQRRKYMEGPGGWSREMWALYAEIGLLMLPFAEADGGLGGGGVETMIVMEEFGRALVLEPYLATVVLGGGFVRLGGSDAQRADIIPRIVDGSLLLAFAQAERGSRYELADVTTTARRDGDGWVISGHKRQVIHGDCADLLVVSARISGDRYDEEGIGLFLVDADAPGVSRRGYVTQDRVRTAEIGFDEVRVAADAVLGEPGKVLPLIERVVDIALAALCADATGTMASALEQTVDYLKTRKQFGVTIGSFQALQHRAVDMMINAEQARSMAMLAAMMCEAPDIIERRRAIAGAKVQIGRSGKFVGENAVQLHGGIGVTEEYQVGHSFRRLTMVEILFGDSEHHLAELARLDGFIHV